MRTRIDTAACTMLCTRCKQFFSAELGKQNKKCKSIFDCATKIYEEHRNFFRLDQKSCSYVNKMQNTAKYKTLQVKPC